MREAGCGERVTVNWLASEAHVGKDSLPAPLGPYFHGKVTHASIYSTGMFLYITT